MTTDFTASMGEWADSSRILVVAPAEEVESLVRFAGLSEGRYVAVHTLDDAFPAVCAERFAAVVLALALEAEPLALAVEELRMVRRGPAIIAVGESANGTAVLMPEADVFVERRTLTTGALQQALLAGLDAGRRVERLVGHVLHQRNLVDSLLEGVVVVSRSGRVVYVNSRACELLGLGEGELLFRSFPAQAVQLADEDGMPVTPEHLASADALRAGKPMERRTLRIRRPDGVVRWVEVFASPVRRRTDHSVYGVVTCFRDVTEERDAQAARLASERRQRRLLEHAADGYMVVDEQLEVTEASQSMARLIPGAVSAGVDATSLVHPDDRGRFRQAIAYACERGGSTRRLEIRVVPPADGVSSPAEERWVEATVTGRCADPSIGGVVVNLADVTARKRAERERRDAEERFRLGFEHGTAGMTLTDLDGRIIEVNRAFCELLGEPAAHLIGTPIAAVVHPDDREERLDQRRKLLGGEINHPLGWFLLVRRLFCWKRFLWLAVSR